MDTPLKQMLDAVFPPEISKEMRITLSEKRLKDLRDGKTLIFKAGKQIIYLAKEK